MSNSEYYGLSKSCANYVRQNHDSKVLATKFLNYIDN